MSGSKPAKTIDQVFAEFLTEQEARLSHSTFSKYRSILDLFGACLERYWPGHDQKDYDRITSAGGSLRIRATQGHSILVDLGLTPVEPPELLYHGTVERFLPSIRRAGLVRGKRHHVHLSGDAETACRVGRRRGPPVVLVIEAGRMFHEGHQFYRSENGVWLTDAVPPRYLQIPEE